MKIRNIAPILSVLCVTISACDSEKSKNANPPVQLTDTDDKTNEPQVDSHQPAVEPFKHPAYHNDFEAGQLAFIEIRNLEPEFFEDYNFIDADFIKLNGPTRLRMHCGDRCEGLPNNGSLLLENSDGEKVLRLYTYTPRYTPSGEYRLWHLVIVGETRSSIDGNGDEIATPKWKVVFLGDIDGQIWRIDDKRDRTITAMEYEIITIKNTTFEDTSAPALKKFWSEKETYKPGDIINFYISVEDSTGLWWSDVRFVSDDESTRFGAEYHKYVLSDGTYHYQIRVPEDAQSGTYRLLNISLMDWLMNRIDFFSDDEILQGYSITIER